MSHVLPYHVALSCQSEIISETDLARAAAALQKQVLRDFEPIWKVAATVAAYPNPDDAPEDAWHIQVRDNIGAPGALGYHTDEHHQPYALVKAGDGWTATVSHELLEMLADPFGRRLWRAASPDVLRREERVRILIEVCDPCEAFTYEVDGVEVSDFATPAWYHTAHAYHALSYLDRLRRPREILAGGYVSWVDRFGEWWQMTWFHDSGALAPKVRKLGRMSVHAREGESTRETIDRITNDYKRTVGWLT